MLCRRGARLRRVRAAAVRRPDGDGRSAREALQKSPRDAAASSRSKRPVPPSCHGDNSPRACTSAYVRGQIAFGCCTDDRGPRLARAKPERCLLSVLSTAHATLLGAPPEDHSGQASAPCMRRALAHRAPRGRMAARKRRRLREEQRAERPFYAPGTLNSPNKTRNKQKYGTGACRAKYTKSTTLRVVLKHCDVHCAPLPRC